jgi:sarcosine oxidase
MATSYDAIILGLGGMGSAAAYHLAARGRRVLGLDQFTPAHDRGSSHGQSRIIRQAYFEDPAYVPLVLRAYELWEQLERETGQHLLTITGGLMLGGAQSAVISGSLRSAQTYNLPYETLDADDIRRRFPPFAPDEDTVGLFERRAGIIRPEASVSAHLGRAQELGATLHWEEPVLLWEADPSGDHVHVTTARGNYAAERLVIAAGHWASNVLAGLGLPLEVERQVQYWFDPSGGVDPFLPERFPIFIWEGAEGAAAYGFPAIDGSHGGVKVAFHHQGEITTPETIDREAHADEIERMRAYLRTHIPALDGALLKAATCMYTNTPDQHFVITKHPKYPQVAIAAGFSGHGYKFASVVGEILADLAINGTTQHPIDLFTPDRFASV